MSLLDRGPHTVTVVPKIATKTDYNTYDFTDGPRFIRSGVGVQQVSAEEAAGLNVDAKSTYRIYGRGLWPGGPHSTIVWQGRTYHQVGDPTVLDMSPRTGHFEVLMESRSTQPK